MKILETVELEETLLRCQTVHGIADGVLVCGEEIWVALVLKLGHAIEVYNCSCAFPS
jgi:hypothetical protein